MRRALVTVCAVVLLGLATAAPAAAASVAYAAPTPLAQQAQSTPTDQDSSAQGTADATGAPSIIPSPDHRGTNNLGGLAVGVVLLGGWGLVGFFLYRQAQRRRTAAEASSPA